MIRLLGCVCVKVVIVVFLWILVIGWIRCVVKWNCVL